MQKMADQAFTENIVLELDPCAENYQTITRSIQSSHSADAVELNPELIENIISAIRTAGGSTGAIGDEQFIIQVPDSADSARILTVVDTGSQFVAIKEEEELELQDEQALILTKQRREDKTVKEKKTAKEGRTDGAEKGDDTPGGSFLVDIGCHGDRWKQLQKLHRFTSHEEVAGYLLDRYERTHDAASRTTCAADSVKGGNGTNATVHAEVKTEPGLATDGSDLDASGTSAHEAADPVLSADHDDSRVLDTNSEDKPAETRRQHATGLETERGRAPRQTRRKRKPHFLKEYIITAEKKPKRQNKSEKRTHSFSKCDKKTTDSDHSASEEEGKVLEAIPEQSIDNNVPVEQVSCVAMPRDEGYLAPHHPKDRKGHLYLGKDRKFQCAKCSAMIKLTSLRHHYLTTHPKGEGKTKEEELVTETCPYCQLSYEPFLARVHEFCAPSICTWEGCNKRLITRKIYNNHYIRHKTAKLVCDICGHCVKGERDMRRHHKRVHGTERFECPECTKRFKQQSYLDVHMRKHTGSRPYICFHCGASFTQKASWNWHMKSKHPTDTSWRNTKVFG